MTSEDIVALSVDAFCRRYGVGRTKVYREIGAGRLRARKFGAKTLILKSDADEWLKGLSVLTPSRST